MNWKRAKCTEPDMLSTDWFGKTVELGRIARVCKITCVDMWNRSVQTQSAKQMVFFYALKRQNVNLHIQYLSVCQRN